VIKDIIICDQCEMASATVSCDDCQGDNYCSSCYKNWHAKGKRATHGLDSPPKSHVVSAPEPILPNPGTNNITSTVDGALFQDELQQIVQESVERKKPLYETAARLTVDGLEKKRKLSDEEYLRSCAVKRGGNKQYTLSKFGEDFGKSTKQFEILSEKMIEFMQ